MQGDSVYYNSGYKVGSLYYYSDENIYSNRYCNLHKSYSERMLDIRRKNVFSPNSVSQL